MDLSLSFSPAWACYGKEAGRRLGITKGHLEDGSSAMLIMDSFNVLEVVRGHLKAAIIDVRPFTAKVVVIPRI
jgi:hypothetical protein